MSADATYLWLFDSVLGMCSISASTGPLPLGIGSGDTTAGGPTPAVLVFDGSIADSRHRLHSPIDRVIVSALASFQPPSQRLCPASDWLLVRLTSLKERE